MDTERPGGYALVAVNGRDDAVAAWTRKNRVYIDGDDGVLDGSGRKLRGTPDVDLALGMDDGCRGVFVLHVENELVRLVGFVPGNADGDTDPKVAGRDVATVYLAVQIRPAAAAQVEQPIDGFRVVRHDEHVYAGSFGT